MEELPLSMKQRTLNPVALLVSSKDLLEPFAALITAADPEKALDFERVGFEYNFPPKKDAKIFERYVTNGILKQTWVDKRKKSIPGVIVLIFDWSGVGTDYPSIDAYDWRTKEQLINKEIRRIKDQIKGRNIKITVIILIRPNEEIDDKMNLVRRQNEIDTKAFFILNGGLEALRPHDKKLSKFLWETAIGHYKDEIERLKKLRSRASKEVMNGNGELPIRYNFKLGYISELRQDREGASNFYKKAYSELCSIGSTDVGHFLELRSVGDWIIHRQLCLLLSPPYNSIKVKEAVSIFKGHITKFRSHKFRSSFDFERYKWLCENYDRLGDLLEKLPYEPKDHDNLWWNPGFYFQTISTYLLTRKKLTKENPTFAQCSCNWREFLLNSGLKIHDPIYLGQPKALATHPLQTEMIEGISLIDQISIVKTLEEDEVDHPGIAINYLTRAINHFKVRGNMMRYVAMCSYQLSEILLEQNAIDNSINLRMDIMKYYETWREIMKDNLNGLVTCWELQAESQELLKWTLQLSSYDLDNQQTLLRNVVNIINRAGNYDVSCPSEIITVKCEFTPDHIHTYEESTLKIEISTILPEDLGPVTATVILGDQHYNHTFETPIVISHTQPQEIHHKLIITDSALRHLEVQKIILNYKISEEHSLTLNCPAAGRLSVIAPEPGLQLTASHKPPALIAERYTLGVTLKPLKNVKLTSLYILETLKESNSEVKRRASIDRETTSSFKVYLHNSEEEVLRDLKFEKVDAEFEQKFDLMFYEEGSYSLRIKALYTVESELGYNYDSEETIIADVAVIPPFRTSSKWSQAELIANTPSRLSVNIQLQKIITEEIKIHKLSLSTKDSWKLIAQEDSPKLSGSLRQLEHFSGCFELVCSKPGKSVDPGDLLIAWSRKGDTMSVCRVPLSSVVVKEVPVVYTVYYESEVFVNKTFYPKLKMKNMTDSKLVVRIKVLENTVFLLGGFEQVSMELDAFGCLEVDYAMFPIMTGQQQSPVIQLNTEDWESSYSQSILVIP